MTFETLVNIIVFVNLGLTIELWRRAALPPEKPKKKFRDRLWSGKPITPKHESPPPREAGMIRKPEEFNRDFEDFANVINWGLAGWAPWRLKEMPTFELSKLAALQPAYGRRYAVFHNQARVGELELEPDDRYSTETPGVTIHIELNWVRLLPFETIRDFLTYMAMHTFEYQRGTQEYFQVSQKIDLAMMDVLWKTQQISKLGFDESGYGQITVQLKGSASSPGRCLRPQTLKGGACRQSRGQRAILSVRRRAERPFRYGTRDRRKRCPSGPDTPSKFTGAGKTPPHPRPVAGFSFERSSLWLARLKKKPRAWR